MRRVCDVYANTHVHKEKQLSRIVSMYSCALTTRNLHTFKDFQNVLYIRKLDPSDQWLCIH